MTAKLTLSMNPMLINRAKAYAKMHGKSVSQIVGDYFSLLNQAVDTKKATSLPLTNSLRGVLKNSDVSEKGYKKHLEDKYLSILNSIPVNSHQHESGLHHELDHGPDHKPQ